MAKVKYDLYGTDAVITGAIRKVIYDSYQDFVKTLLSDCGFDPQLGGLPIKVMFHHTYPVNFCFFKL
jgi:hypothetical protein